MSKPVIPQDCTVVVMPREMTTSYHTRENRPSIV